MITMRYRITAANPQFAGEIADAQFHRGVAEVDEGSRALAYCRRRRGYTVELIEANTDDAGDESLPDDSDGSGDGEQLQEGSDNADGAVAEVPGSSETGTETPARPADSANKTVWVDYAVDRGADRADAEAATKLQLIHKYG